MYGLVHAASVIPWLDPQHIIESSGGWALLVVSLIVFAETGLLVGFILPGDTLLVISGLLTNVSFIFGVDIWLVAAAISLAAFLGGEVGYYIGKKSGPAIFERKDSGLFSKENVAKTMYFFDKYGPWAVVVARFVPIVRTFAPVAAGVGKMSYRRYSLYNALGAVLWAFSLTFLGYFVGYVPWIATFVVNYIDLILLAIVVGTLGIVGVHYFRERSKVKKSAAAEAAANVATDPTK